MKITKQMDTEELVVTMSRSEFINTSAKISAKITYELMNQCIFKNEPDNKHDNVLENPVTMLAIDTLSKFMNHFDDTVFSIEDEKAEESKNQ